MMDDLEQKIKEMLLQELIDKMSEGSEQRLKPKGLGVQVEAKDPEALKAGLDKAKSLLGKGAATEDESELPTSDSSEEDDEQRLLQLLSEDDDDDFKGR